MILPIYTGKGWGKLRASFDPRPGLRPCYLKVPGGSELLETMLLDGRHKVLFAPTVDPLCSAAWSAEAALKAAKECCSPFRLIRTRTRISRQGRPR